MENTSGKLKIIIADDHCVVREGIVRALTGSFSELITAEASNSTEVLKLLNEFTWDIIILDVSMPGRNGIDLLTDIVAQYPQTRVIIFSMYPEDQFAIRALRAGAAAYITKDTPLRVLTEAVRRISHGERFLTISIAELLANEILENKNDKQPHEILSDREYQVFTLIASGKPVSAIAAELSLSVKTVSVYRANVLKKMGLHNNAEITHYAFKHSLVD